ncbi:MAG: hypothetical protein KBC69_00375 [Candidatus Magasanikbacteria bacterium]|nr:hypothetical protein [Candidatus Magasanikbacteria bacterium]
MKPIASSPSYRLTLWKLAILIVGATTLVLLVMLYMLFYSVGTSGSSFEPKNPPPTHTQPKMIIETVVTIQKGRYGTCLIYEQANMAICTGHKTITTSRYELQDDGDIILRGDFISSIFVDGYVDNCGNFYTQQLPLFKITYPTITICPSDDFVRNYP